LEERFFFASKICDRELLFAAAENDENVATEEEETNGDSDFPEAAAEKKEDDFWVEENNFFEEDGDVKLEDEAERAEEDGDCAEAGELDVKAMSMSSATKPANTKKYVKKKEEKKIRWNEIRKETIKSKRTSTGEVQIANVFKRAKRRLIFFVTRTLSLLLL